ncbi:multicopper oxidase mco-like [Clavelina lepadiformis]|uniref:multicopper oxidase mco-like n=1 Tax=Clavelina lepadiformis TaxID=159417 RepID=UPI00404301F1
MKGVVVIFLLLAICQCNVRVTSQECSESQPCRFVGGDPFNFSRSGPMSDLVSSDGFLEVDLTVAVNPVVVEWLTLFRRTYNGGFPGPVWRFKPGDTVMVNLINTLQYPDTNNSFNQLRFANSTNLHTHGLHISSEKPQDNVFVHVNPEDAFTYEYEIDSQHPAGTYWYHPHLHGSTLFHVHSGMAGMIIVEDDPDPSITPQHLLDVSCPDNCHHEVRLLFQPTLLYADNYFPSFPFIQENIHDHNAFEMSDALKDWLKNNGVDYFTTNGQLWPEITFQAGQMKRFRMVNAGGNAALILQITDTNGAIAEGCTVYQIALDGIYFDSATPPRLGKTMLVPSAKSDWLVVCNIPGTYELRSVKSPDDDVSMGGMQQYQGKLLTIKINGTLTSTVIPTPLPAKQSFVSDFRNLTEDEVTGRFVIEVGPDLTLNRERFQSKTNFRFVANLDTVQEWYIINTATSAHPIHIHVNNFQVISYNNYTGPIGAKVMENKVFFDQNKQQCDRQYENFNKSIQAMLPDNDYNKWLKYRGHAQRWRDMESHPNGTLGYSPSGIFHDVILVPPFSNITIRFRTDRFIGTVVIHCHILYHEDQGMMMVTKIVPAGANTTGAHIKSGDAYPGQCSKCDPFPFNEVVGECSGSRRKHFNIIILVTGVLATFILFIVTE